MNIEQFKQDIKSWSDEKIKEQYYLNLDTREMCWDNAQDCNPGGFEYYHWLDEYNEAKEMANALEAEAEHRKIEL